jgi:hypothetical protein
MATHSAFLRAMLVVILVQLAAGAQKKFTVALNKSKAVCFSEVLEHKGFYKITYHVLDMRGKKLKLENPDDSIVGIYFSRSIDGSKIFSSVKYSDIYSHEVYGSSYFMSFCAENFSDEVSVKFSVEIAWALEINDFSKIPLTVGFLEHRPRTARLKSPCSASRATRTTSYP